MSRRVTNPTRQARSNAGKREPLRLLYVSPWVLFSVCAVALPLASLVLVAFMTDDAPRPPISDFTLNNLQQVWTTAAFRGTVLRTFVYSVVTMLVLLVLAVPCAYALVTSKRSQRVKLVVLLLLTLPFFAGPMARIIGLSAMLGTNGAVNYLGTRLGILDEPVSWLLQSPFAVVVALVYNNLGLVLFPTWLAMARGGAQTLDVARDLGASRSTVFWRVALPRAFSGVAAGVVLASVSISASFLEPERMGGSTGRFLANSTAAQFLTTLNWPLGASLALTLVMVTWVGGGAALLLLRLAMRTLTRWPLGASVSGRWKLNGFSLSTFILVLCTGLILTPILLIALFSVNGSPYYGFPVGDFSWKWYGELAQSTALHQALWSTFLVSFGAAVVSTVLGAPFAYALARNPGSARLFVLAVWPIAVPTLVLGIALQSFIGQSGVLSLGYVATVLGYVGYLTPFVILVVYSSLAGIDWSVDDIARDLGANRRQFLARIAWPLSWMGVRSGLMIAFILTFNEYNLGLFLARGFNTLTTSIASMGSYGVRPEVLALSTCINVGIVVLVLVLIPTLERLFKARRAV